MVGAIHLACFIALSVLLRGAPPQSPGWRVVGPSWTHWFCFVGSWAFSALKLFVGSARRDAEVQMAYLLALIFAFGAGAVLSGSYMVRLRRTSLR
jgi:hypothetical protein